MSYSPQSFPSQQYPPQGQAPMPMYQPQMPMYQPPMRKGHNIVGIIALVMAVIGFIFACVPGALIIGWVLLPISFIMGLVGLFRKGEVLWPAITAVIVSVIGTIAGVLVFLALLGSAVDEATSSTSAVSASVAPSGTSSDARGSRSSGQGKTRENPYPLGTEISGEDWKVVVNSVTFNANDAVARRTSSMIRPLLEKNIFSSTTPPHTSVITRTENLLSSLRWTMSRLMESPLMQPDRPSLLRMASTL